MPFGPIDAVAKQQQAQASGGVNQLQEIFMKLQGQPVASQDHAQPIGPKDDPNRVSPMTKLAQSLNAKARAKGAVKPVVPELPNQNKPAPVDVRYPLAKSFAEIDKQAGQQWRNNPVVKEAITQLLQSRDDEIGRGARLPSPHHDPELMAKVIKAARTGDPRAVRFAYNQKVRERFPQGVSTDQADALEMAGLPFTASALAEAYRNGTSAVLGTDGKQYGLGDAQILVERKTGLRLEQVLAQYGGQVRPTEVNSQITQQATPSSMSGNVKERPFGSRGLGEKPARSYGNDLIGRFNEAADAVSPLTMPISAVTQALSGPLVEEGYKSEGIKKNTPLAKDVLNNPDVVRAMNEAVAYGAGADLVLSFAAGGIGAETSIGKVLHGFNKAQMFDMERRASLAAGAIMGDEATQARSKEELMSMFDPQSAVKAGGPSALLNVLMNVAFVAGKAVRAKTVVKESPFGQSALARIAARRKGNAGPEMATPETATGMTAPEQATVAAVTKAMPSEPVAPEAAPAETVQPIPAQQKPEKPTKVVPVKGTDGSWSVTINGETTSFKTKAQALNHIKAQAFREAKANAETPATPKPAPVEAPQVEPAPEPTPAPKPLAETNPALKAALEKTDPDKQAADALLAEDLATSKPETPKPKPEPKVETPAPMAEPTMTRSANFSNDGLYDVEYNGRRGRIHRDPDGPAGSGWYIDGDGHHKDRWIGHLKESALQHIKDGGKRWMDNSTPVEAPNAEAPAPSVAQPKPAPAPVEVKPVAPTSKEPAATNGGADAERLREKLAKLRLAKERGAITDEAFAAEEAKTLDALAALGEKPTPEPKPIAPPKPPKVEVAPKSERIEHYDEIKPGDSVTTRYGNSYDTMTAPDTFNGGDWTLGEGRVKLETGNVTRVRRNGKVIFESEPSPEAPKPATPEPTGNRRIITYEDGGETRSFELTGDALKEWNQWHYDNNLNPVDSKSLTTGKGGNLAVGHRIAELKRKLLGMPSSSEQKRDNRWHIGDTYTHTDGKDYTYKGTTFGQYVFKGKDATLKFSKEDAPKPNYAPKPMPGVRETTPGKVPPPDAPAKPKAVDPTAAPKGKPTDAGLFDSDPASDVAPTDGLPATAPATPKRTPRGKKDMSSAERYREMFGEDPPPDEKKLGGGGALALLPPGGLVAQSTGMDEDDAKEFFSNPAVVGSIALTMFALMRRGRTGAKLRRFMVSRLGPRSEPVVNYFLDPTRVDSFAKFKTEVITAFGNPSDVARQLAKNSAIGSFKEVAGAIGKDKAQLAQREMKKLFGSIPADIIAGEFDAYFNGGKQTQRMKDLAAHVGTLVGGDKAKADEALRLMASTVNADSLTAANTVSSVIEAAARARFKSNISMLNISRIVEHHLETSGMLNPGDAFRTIRGKVQAAKVAKAMVMASNPGSAGVWTAVRTFVKATGMETNDIYMEGLSTRIDEAYNDAQAAPPGKREQAMQDILNERFTPGEKQMLERIAAIHKDVIERSWRAGIGVQEENTYERRKELLGFMVGEEIDGHLINKKAYDKYKIHLAATGEAPDPNSPMYPAAEFRRGIVQAINDKKSSKGTIEVMVDGELYFLPDKAKFQRKVNTIGALYMPRVMKGDVAESIFRMKNIDKLAKEWADANYTDRGIEPDEAIRRAMADLKKMHEDSQWEDDPMAWFAGLQRRREFNLPPEWTIRNYGEAMGTYTTRAEKRIAVAEVTGTPRNDVFKLLIQAESDPATQRYLSKLIGTTYDMGPDRPIRNTVGKSITRSLAQATVVRLFSGGTTAFAQVLDVASTMARVPLRSSVLGAKQALTMRAKGDKTPEWLAVSTDATTSARLFRAMALADSHAREDLFPSGSRIDNKTNPLARMADMVTTVFGIKATDVASKQFTMAANWNHLEGMLYKVAGKKKLSGAEQRALEAYGVTVAEMRNIGAIKDPKAARQAVEAQMKDPNFQSKFAMNVRQDLMYTGMAEQLPQWMTATTGSDVIDTARDLALLLKKPTYLASRYVVKELMGEASKGNLKPTFKFIASAGLMSWSIDYIRAMLGSALDPEEAQNKMMDRFKAAREGNATALGQVGAFMQGMVEQAAANGSLGVWGELFSVNNRDISGRTNMSEWVTGPVFQRANDYLRVKDKAVEGDFGGTGLFGTESPDMDAISEEFWWQVRRSSVLARRAQAIRDRMDK